MDPIKILNYKKGPERIIQDKIVDFMILRGWLVLSTHGNLYQKGFPDLYCSHKTYGIRWIEVKNPTQYSFTPSQYDMFPKFLAHGTPIWVLVDGTEEEYKKLWRPANLGIYMALLGQRSCVMDAIKKTTK